MPVADLAWFDRWSRPADSIVCWRAAAPLSFAALQQRVATLAARLPTTPGQRWLLWCDDSFEFLVGLLALWQAGHSAVLPANAQPATLAHAGVDCAGMLSDATGDLLGSDLTESDSHFSLKQLSTAAVGEKKFAADPITSPITSDPIASLTGSAAIPPDAVHSLKSDALALELFTAGSTGAPKRVRRTLRQLQAELQALQRQFPLPAATVLATVPHHHIYGLLFRLLWPLASGRAFVADVEHYPEPLLAQIPRYAPALLISSPAHLERLPGAIDLRRVADQLVAVFSSGAPLPRTAALQLQQALGAAPFEVLGSTETGGVAWRQRSADEAQDDWQLLPGVQARLADDGVLQVLSPAAERQDWLALGDRAEWTREGRFQLLGRADRVVKIEAKRLSLTELENALLAHAAVQEASALVLAGSRQIVAVVIRLTAQGEHQLQHHGKRALNELLRAHLARQFERVLLPKRFRYVAELPRDARGKLTQQALSALFADETLP